MFFPIRSNLFLLQITGNLWQEEPLQVVRRPRLCWLSFLTLSDWRDIAESAVEGRGVSQPQLPLLLGVLPQKSNPPLLSGNGHHGRIFSCRPQASWKELVTFISVVSRYTAVLSRLFYVVTLVTSLEKLVGKLLSDVVLLWFHSLIGRNYIWLRNFFTTFFFWGKFNHGVLLLFLWLSNYEFFVSQIASFKLICKLGHIYTNMFN